MIPPQLYSYYSSVGIELPSCSISRTFIVNGNQHAKGLSKTGERYSSPRVCRRTILKLPFPRAPGVTPRVGPKKVREWNGKPQTAPGQDNNPFRRSPIPHGHTVRTRLLLCMSMTHLCRRLERSRKGFFLGDVGLARYTRHACDFRRDPGERLRQLRIAITNVLFHMLFPGSNCGRVYSLPENGVAGIVKHAARREWTLFRMF